MRERLSHSDWIRHGFRTLTLEGPAALKVGPMAAKLDVSRGSFYWHFRDIADFRGQLLDRWAKTSTDRVIEELEARPGDPDRLRNLLQAGLRGRRRLERAIRSWGSHDETAAAVVAAVDERRIGGLANLLADADVEPEQARRRAVFLYWAYLGQAAVMDPAHGTLPDDALADLARLLQS